MNDPLEKELKQAHQIYKKDHERLREKLVESLADYQGRPEQTSRSECDGLSIGDMIMSSRILKIAAGLIIISIIILAFNFLVGPINGSNVAFGQVINYFQEHNYTFDLTPGIAAEQQDTIPFTIRAMVSELGRMRVSLSAGPGVGDISSITDFNTGKTLLLFHQDQTAAIKQEPILNKNAGAEGIVSICSEPIENLWNLRDGTEEKIGEKEINAQRVTGFKVVQEDQNYKYDITIWADSVSGVPNLVEIIAKPFDESYPSLEWTMANFDLDTELDEELFSIELPPGYTLAYQEDLENLEVETVTSAEAQKIVQMLDLWSQDRKDEAVAKLLDVDWTKPVEFGKEPYIFTITEKGYTSLKADDQVLVNDETSPSLAYIRAISNLILSLGRDAVSAQKYKEAEKYFDSGLQLGKLLHRNPDMMVIIRLVGIAIEKNILNEQIKLYTAIANREKLQEAEQRLGTVQAETDKIREEATSQ